MIRKRKQKFRTMESLRDKTDELLLKSNQKIFEEIAEELSTDVTENVLKRVLIRNI